MRARAAGGDLPHDGDCRDILRKPSYVLERVRVDLNLDGLALSPGGEIPATCTRGQWVAGSGSGSDSESSRKSAVRVWSGASRW